MISSLTAPDPRVIESVRALGMAVASADRARLEAALRTYTEPLRVAIAGRSGTGRDTLARALRERLGVSPIGPGDDQYDADAWIYVLVAGVRDDDRAALARLPADRTIVVLGKADTHGSWEDAHERAASCSTRLERPVIAVMPLLATARLRDEEFMFLQMLSRSGEEMPSMAGEFLSGSSDERGMRMRLLRRLDQFGLDIAFAVMAQSPAVTADDLAGVLGRICGIDALLEPLTSVSEAVRVQRNRRLRGQLEHVAAVGIARDQIERILAEVA